MMLRSSLAQRVTILILSLCAMGLPLAASTATAQHAFVTDMPMEVSSSGARDLKALIMFVVDVIKPFSSPAQFE